MIVWKGWGILALLIPLVISLGISAGVDSYYEDEVYKNSTWAMPMALVLSSIVVFLTGRKINNKPGRILIDPENNQEIEIKTVHTMFWIPLQYWGVIILGISVWMYVSNIGLIYNN